MQENLLFPLLPSSQSAAVLAGQGWDLLCQWHTGTRTQSPVEGQPGGPWRVGSSYTLQWLEPNQWENRGWLAFHPGWLKHLILMLISIFHETSKDQAKFLLSLAELNSSKGIFLMKSSEIVKKTPTNPTPFLSERKLILCLFFYHSFTPMLLAKCHLLYIGGIWLHNILIMVLVTSMGCTRKGQVFHLTGIAL